MSANLPPALFQSIQHGLLTKYFIISAETILIFDYILMLPSEIKHIWFANWGPGSVLYMLTRYVAFVESPFIMLYAFDVGLSRSPHAGSLCKNIYQAVAWLDYMGIFIAMNILNLRTAAVWGWSRRALIICILTDLFVLPISAYSLTKTLRSARYDPSPVPSLFPCNLVFGTDLAYVDFLIVVVNETVVIALTVYRRLRSWPDKPSPLLQTLFYDAVLFFICLGFLSLINLILYKTPSLSDFYQLMVQMQHVLHSVTTARIILHLRITSCDPSANDGTVVLSEDCTKNVAFGSRSPSYGGTARSRSHTLTDWDEISFEMDNRGSSCTVVKETKKIVVDPYMI